MIGGEGQPEQSRHCCFWIQPSCLPFEFFFFLLMPPFYVYIAFSYIEISRALSMTTYVKKKIIKMKYVSFAPFVFICLTCESDEWNVTSQKKTIKHKTWSWYFYLNKNTDLETPGYAATTRLWPHIILPSGNKNPKLFPLFLNNITSSGLKKKSERLSCFWPTNVLSSGLNPTADYFTVCFGPWV